MNIWHQYPFVRLIFPFIAGITTAVYCSYPFHFPLLLTILLLILIYGVFIFFLSQNVSYSNRWIVGVLIHLILFLVGYEYTILRTASFNLRNISHFEQGKSEMLIQIDDPVVERANSYKVVARTLMLKDTLAWIETTGKVVFYFEKSDVAQQLKYGDRLLVHSTLNKVSPPMNPGEFNYKRYLSNKGIYNQGFVRSQDWTVISTGHGNRIKSFGTRLRQNLLEILSDQNIKGREYAVASAILLGFDGYLEPEQIREFSGAGAMHILCVSGLHVGIIYVILNFLLKFLNRNTKTRIAKVFLLLIMIWIYALTTGLSPSVMRATVMFSFVALGGLISRKTGIYNTLTASAFVLLIIDPFFITDVGFQLSYLAVFGIVMLYQPIYHLWVSRNRILRNIWQISAVSIAATLITFPLSLFYFHQFPNFFLLTNLVAIPASTMIIYGGLLVLGTSFIPFVSMIFAKILTGIIWFLNISVKTIEGLPFAALRGVYINSFELVLLFCLIIAGISFFFSKKKGYFILALCSMMVLLFSVTNRKYQNLNTRKIVVYSVNKATALDFIDGNSGILLLDTSILNDENKINYHIRNNWIISGLGTKCDRIGFHNNILLGRFIKQDDFVQFCNKSLVLIGPDFKTFTSQRKFRVNYLLLNHDPKIHISELVEIFDFDLVIIDNSNSYRNTNQWIRECNQLDIEVYSVRHNGAWEREI